MKQLTIILLLLSSITFWGSCDTYDDYDVDYNVVYPLGGEYFVSLYDAANPSVLIDQADVIITNTAAEDKDIVWFTCSAYNEDLAVKGKISCNVKALSFTGSNVPNSYGDPFSVTEGLVSLKGFTSDANTQIDKITFTLQLSQPVKGVSKLIAVGNRAEFWE